MAAQQSRSGFTVLVMGAALLGACTAAGPAPAPQADTVGQRSVSAPDYVIGPGDTLSVFVYRAQELGADGLPVRPDGKLSLPLIPDIEAAGKTPTQLAREIERRLKEYVREPNVTVMVRSFIGQPNRQIRVMDVMIEVRGLTRYAAGNRAHIARREREDAPAQQIPVRLSDLLRDGDISQDVAMRPGDTLVIPQSWF